MLRRKKEIIAPALEEKTAPQNLQKSFGENRLGAVAGLLVVLLVGAVAFAATTSYSFYRTVEQSTAEVEKGELATEALSPAPAAPAAAPTPPPQQQQRTEAELITITPRGFEPSEIKRPAGRVLLAVVNRSERNSMTLRLERENGGALGQAQVPRNRRHWRMPVTLPAGRYRIVDTTRPNMVCNIEITP